MTVVEFVWWSSTDEFLANFETLFKPTVDHVSAAAGCLKVYYGLEDEDRTNFWMVVVWQSHAHHQAMMDRPDYPAMVARLKPFFRDGQLRMNHVEFNKDTGAAFGAPVSAILFLNSKEDDDIDQALQVSLATADTRPHYLSATWGQTQEDARQSILIMGHKEENGSSSIPTTMDISQVVHVKFKSSD